MEQSCQLCRQSSDRKVLIMLTLREGLLLCATAPLWVTESYSPFTKRRFSWKPKRLSGRFGPTLRAAISSKTPCVVTADDDLSHYYDFRELIKRRPATTISAVPLGEKDTIDQFGMPKSELTLTEVNDWIHTPSKGRLFAWLPLHEMGDVPQAIPHRLGWNDIHTAMSGMFVSSQGYITRIHCDWEHGFLTQIHGRKRITLIAPQASRHLYLNSPFSTPIPRYATKLPSKIVDAISTFPGLANAHIEQIVLREGETLYTPPFWWHEVETLEPSASLAIRYNVPWHGSLSARVFELLIQRLRFAILQRAAKLIVKNNLAHMLKQ